MPVQSLICLGIKVSPLVATRPVRKQHAYGLYSHAETNAQTLSDYQFCLSLRALSFHLGQYLDSTHGHKPHVSLPLLHRGFPPEQRKIVTNRLEETLMSQSNPPISSTLYGFYGHFSKMYWRWPPNTLQCFQVGHQVPPKRSLLEAVNRAASILKVAVLLKSSHSARGQPWPTDKA